MCAPLPINRLVPAGVYSITAIATDNYGASTTTAPISVISDTPPTIGITAPANNAIVHTPVNVSITADAASAMSTIAKVEFYNGTTLLGSSTTAPYSFTWNSVAVGNYSLTAVATDNYGIQTTSAPISLTVKLGELLPYYIHTDHLDTPREITDTGGNVVWQWDNTDPFGNNAPNENPGGLGKFEQPLRFPGQYADRETNLYYNINRDYDPAIGRYIQSDPIGLAGGINTYTYVDGNPVSYRDPSGNELVGALIGTVAGVSAGYVAGGYTGAFFGGVAGAATGFVAPWMSTQAATAVAQIVGSDGIASAAASVTAFQGAGIFAAMGATTATNVVNGDPWNNDMGWAVAVGLMAPIASGEIGVVAAGEGAVGRMAANIYSAATGAAGIFGAAIDPNSSHGLNPSTPNVCH